MTGDDITPQQARRILRWLTPALELFQRLHDRMREQGFPEGDGLFRAAGSAMTAVQYLHAALVEKSLPEWSRRNRGE